MTDWKKIRENLKNVGEILVDSAKEIRKGVEEEIKEKKLDEKFKKTKDTMAEKLEDIGKEVSSFIANLKENKPTEPTEGDDEMQKLFKAIEDVTTTGNILKREEDAARREVAELSVKLHSAKENYDYYSKKLNENRKLAEKLNELVLSQDYSKLDSILSELRKD